MIGFRTAKATTSQVKECALETPEATASRGSVGGGVVAVGDPGAGPGDGRNP